MVMNAVNWPISLGLSSVNTERNSMLTIEALHQHSRNLLEVGNLLSECRTLLRVRPGFSVSCVRKQAKKAAHMLAKVPCEVFCFHEFLTPLQIVLEYIMYDASLV